MSNRSNSGTRNGTTDFVRTIHDLQKESNKNINAKELESRFAGNFKQSYPTATADEAKQKLATLIKDHDWGSGTKLGTATDVVKAIKRSRNAAEATIDKVVDSVKTMAHAKEQIREIAKEDTGRTQVEASREQFNKYMTRKGKETKDKKEDILATVENSAKHIQEGKNMISRKEVLKAFADFLKNKTGNKQRMKKAEADMLLNRLGFDAELSRKAIEEEEKSAIEEAAEYAKQMHEHARQDTKDREEDKRNLEENTETYNRESKQHYKQPANLRGEPPKRPDSRIKPFDPNSIAPEEDMKEERQFKKINRKNVGDIDNDVKVEKSDLNTHVKPTVHLSDVQKMLAKHKQRLKIKPAKITFHRLGKPIAKATHDNF